MFLLYAPLVNFIVNDIFFIGKIYVVSIEFFKRKEQQPSTYTVITYVQAQDRYQNRVTSVKFKDDMLIERTINLILYVSTLN